MNAVRIVLVRAEQEEPAKPPGQKQSRTGKETSVASKDCCNYPSGAVRATAPRLFTAPLGRDPVADANCFRFAEKRH